MKIYRDDFDMSLIFIGVNRYWKSNDALRKYDVYKIIKQFKHSNPLEFKNRSMYNALDNEDEPLYYYDKCNVVTPRKFIPTLKRLDLLAFRAIKYTCMRKKLCTDYYLPIYNVGK